MAQYNPKHQLSITQSSIHIFGIWTHFLDAEPDASVTIGRCPSFSVPGL
jgi:hypothetical protein